MFEIINRRVLGKVIPEHREILEGLNAAFTAMPVAFKKAKPTDYLTRPRPRADELKSDLPRASLLFPNAIKRLN